ncbi:glycosyltransferase family protein [Terasakiella sp. A23]|uniref:glycosyltransferase family protein n=1 Tax=Terasakiella sp. FCG-A23 TaxID=3080561 RepID=UPI002954B18E|nr:glycosyltransferase family protein [Terasakiella sp. A23]MDV7339046.1 glycosyltransferase family protein [Terasakiella sp. A23]
MNITLIVQARLGSNRLPGKVLKEIEGHSALKYNLTRCMNVSGITQVCCAVPESAENDPVAQEAERMGVKVVRGPEDDVLARYYKAAKKLDSRVIVRVTSDCPFLDPEVVSKTLSLYLQGGYEFVCNNHPPTWPHGFDCEVTSMSWLEKAHQEAQNSQQREHVMPFIRTHSEVTIGNYQNPVEGQNNLRWTLDYPEDLDFFRAVAKYLKAPLTANTSEIMEVIRKKPELMHINGQWHEKNRV